MSTAASQNRDAHPYGKIQFADELFTPMPSGALYWEAQSTMLVADLHLEKMSSFARGGQLLPPYDSFATLRQLDKDIQAFAPDRVVSLGDSFHRDEGTGTLPPDARALLLQLVSEREWIWVAGNHDPSPHNLGGQCCAEFQIAGIFLTHEPSNMPTPTIAGHLHPAARIHINGRSTRKPCFAADQRLLLMPAYGVSTGSINILSGPFVGLFDHAQLQVVMLGRARTYPVSPNRLIAG